MLPGGRRRFDSVEVESQIESIKTGIESRSYT